MAAPLPLEGDGLVENLFHYLWTTDDLGGGPRVSVPPTVIYRGSQPVAWYFTSRKSGRIKRKHRANLTAAHIEHSFTKRRATTDIVAYYLYLPKSDSTSPAIEYFDTEALRDFLFKRPDIPHSSSPGSLQTTGILQHFSLPKGARNSTLRAIWSPKLCLLERRVNVHAIHDARFSVYERGVTFEEGSGAESLSRPEPVRGSMLPGMVQQVCERVVDHVTRVSYHKFRIARMVLRLQVDSDDRLWLLWSSSLRLQPPLTPTAIVIAPDMPNGETNIRPLDIVGDVKVPAFAFAQGSGGGTVSLSSTSCPEVDEEPRPGQMRCASCAQVVAHRALLPTTYKAVLAHFHHVFKFLRERENQVSIEWPPDEHVVQQAGGVGFGILRYLKSVSSSSDDSSLPKTSSTMKVWQGREFLVPPVIRYMHPTLRAEDFTRHRQDPIFLHKTVGVCERCCLVYADYATASLEANGLGIRTSASAPALLRPVREKPKHTQYFDDDRPGSLLLTTVNSPSPLSRGTHTATSKTKPPASAWKPVCSDEHRSEKHKAGPRSTLNSLPMAPKLPPRIDSFEADDNDALRIPDSIHDSSPQLKQQQREETFFRELYQQKNKKGGQALRHILEAADRLSKAKPQHHLAALGDSAQIGQSQSTGALIGAITELKLSKNPGKSPYSIVQRIRGGAESRLEHIESLTSLVISAPDIEANPILLDQKEKQHRREKKSDEDKHPPIPQEENIEEMEAGGNQEVEEQNQHESEPNSQNDDKQNHVNEEDKLIEDEEQAGKDTLENLKYNFEGETSDHNAEVELKPLENDEDGHSYIPNPTLAEVKGNEMDQHPKIGQATENDTHVGLEKTALNDFDDEVLDVDQPLLLEVETEPIQYEQDGHVEETDTQNQELGEVQSNGVKNIKYKNRIIYRGSKMKSKYSTMKADQSNSIHRRNRVKKMKMKPITKMSTKP
ncbi:hypothetical protein PHMEG_0002118 [Phytophthora megakarya]|uniref:Uncharacterized protein n=1 Tax=Phytophthora megakarya TaxID=4795 RepID=A0A225X014_9STRA|nr:hypothetical protein PHMEG_0002118 [Phytophthora megakarya]